jgi:hypothetical protein
MRLRVEQLDALEREEFDVLPGEVYVRASLRTYANYLTGAILPVDGGLMLARGT